MADNENNMESNEANEPEVLMFHTDPTINVVLVRLETLVREYKAAHASQTGSTKDKQLEEYKAGLPKADKDNLPDMEDITEWVWNDATPAELLLFMEVAKGLVDDIGFVFRRFYVGTKTTDRPEVMESLSDHRKRVVRAILDIMNMANNDIFPGLTEDMIRDLPSVEFSDRKNKDGTVKEEGEYINLPRAPKSPSDNQNTPDGPKPLRSNNSKVMVVVNGQIYIPKGTTEFGTKLGGACMELFKKNVQQCAKDYFNNWADRNNDKLYQAPDGTWYGLRTIS